MTILTEARNADLADLAALLQTQHAAKRDLVVSAAAIRSRNGQMHIADGAVDLVVGADGTPTEAPRTGILRPTTIFDEGLAAKLEIPVAYLKRLRATRPDIYDANVNGWLHGSDEFQSDRREFLVRTFQDQDPETATDGIARAFLSDKFRMLDHFDILTEALGALKDTDAEAKVVACDLSERRMYVKVVSPTISVMAPDLLRGYRSPFVDTDEKRAGWTVERARQVAAREGQGYEPGSEPVVFAGFVIANSETGGGAYTLTPRVEFQVCKNGLVLNADALRNVHLGGKLEAGVIDWSAETVAANLKLVASQTRDAVKLFLNPEYVEKALARIGEQAEVKVTDPVETVKVVAKSLKLTDERGKDVLRHFILGGQTTAGGVMQAVTSVAQIVADPEEANALEGMAVEALALAAAAN